jgi:FkbM family methyltransferase
MLNLAKRLYRAVLPKTVQRRGYRAFTALMGDRIVRRDLGGYCAELHLGEVMELAAFVGEFEPDMGPLIDRLTQPGMIVCDIGANVGLHALHFAHRVGAEGKVYAFEPSDFAFRKLVRNVALNPHLNLEAEQLALSNETKTAVEVDFRSSWRHDGSRGDLSKSVVDFTLLDDWVAQRGLDRIDIIKLDVDGYEGLVLDGARATLARFRPQILIEAGADQYRDDDRADAFAILVSLGYRLQTTRDTESLTPVSIRERVSDLVDRGSDSFNVLASFDDSAA